MFAAYFVEAGLILIVAPWSGFWDRNFFTLAVPSLVDVLGSPYARGAVSGVGLVTLLAGLAELAGAFASKRDAQTSSPPTHVPSDHS